MSEFDTCINRNVRLSSANLWSDVSIYIVCVCMFVCICFICHSLRCGSFACTFHTFPVVLHGTGRMRNKMSKWLRRAFIANVHDSAAVVTDTHTRSLFLFNSLHFFMSCRHFWLCRPNSCGLFIISTVCPEKLSPTHRTITTANLHQIRF